MYLCMNYVEAPKGYKPSLTKLFSRMIIYK